MKKFIIAIALALVASVTFAAEHVPVYGDSIMSDIPEAPFSQHALSLLSQEQNVSFRNLSSPGGSLGGKGAFGYNNVATATELSRIKGLFNAVDFILIQAGTNDFGAGVPLADMQASLTRILDWAKTNNKKVLMLDIIWRADEGTNNKIGLTLDHYRYVRGVTCLNYPTVCVFAHRDGTPLGQPHYNFPQSEISAGKSLHPDAAGHRMMADWIAAAAAAANLL